MTPRAALLAIATDFASDLAGFLVLCLALYALVRMNNAWQEWRSDRRMAVDTPDLRAFRQRQRDELARIAQRQLADAIRTEATQ